MPCRFGYQQCIFHHMIKFYRTRNCLFCDEIVLKLQELVVAHDVVFLDEHGIETEMLPYIEEGRHVYRSETEMRQFVRLLEGDVTQSRESQSDSCIISSDGQCL